MKKTAVILLSSTAIIVFTVVVAILCFRLYYHHDNSDVGNVEIVIGDKGKGVDIEQLLPISDEEAKKMNYYKFDVKNNGNIDSRYQVLIEEVELRDKKGYRKSELLSRNQLRYELKLDGKVIASDDMSEIKNNIIDERIIPVSKTNKYQLKVWIPQSANNTNWRGKYYRYKVNIQAVSEENK